MDFTAIHGRIVTGHTHSLVAHLTGPWVLNIDSTLSAQDWHLAWPAGLRWVKKGIR